jgi:SAM-dependent methyltransferase
MSAPEWSDPAHVQQYLTRTGGAERIAEGERALLELVPATARRVLDLGTGAGRLLALLGEMLPELEGLGIDSSPLMLAAAAEQIGTEGRFELLDHDLARALPELGRFDAVVSGRAIHHLEHERKRSLYGEIFGALEPGGTFANFEHVASPTRRLHLDFFAAIEEPLEFEDPSDRLLDVETQLGWLRACGFEDVDCHWKWRELAILTGVRPGAAVRGHEGADG